MASFDQIERSSAEACKKFIRHYKGFQTVHSMPQALDLSDTLSIVVQRPEQRSWQRVSLFQHYGWWSTTL